MYYQGTLMAIRLPRLLCTSNGLASPQLPNSIPLRPVQNSQDEPAMYALVVQLLRNRSRMVTRFQKVGRCAACRSRLLTPIYSICTCIQICTGPLYLWLIQCKLRPKEDTTEKLMSLITMWKSPCKCNGSQRTWAHYEFRHERAHNIIYTKGYKRVSFSYLPKYRLGMKQ